MNVKRKLCRALDKKKAAENKKHRDARDTIVHLLPKDKRKDLKKKQKKDRLANAVLKRKGNFVPIADIKIPDGYRAVDMDEIKEYADKQCTICQGAGIYLVIEKDSEHTDHLCQCAYDRFQSLKVGAKTLKNGLLIVEKSKELILL
jgi:hypothetical protein